MKLIYITEGIGPVFQSQVVELLNNIVQRTCFDEVHLCMGLRDKEDLTKINQLNQKIFIHYFRTYPVYPVFNYLTQVSLRNLFSELEVNEDFLIHTRTEHAGYLSYKAYKKNNRGEPLLLIDIRGAVVEEILIYGKINKLLKFLKLFRYKENIQYVLSKASAVNVVSKALKKHINNTFKVPVEKITVIPTIAGSNFFFSLEERNKIRQELSIKNDETLFVFSSNSTGAWQNESLCVDLITSKGYKVLMLTKGKYDDDKVISKFVPYQEVASYLNAADIGIIYRHDDVVNNVAAPIKFVEYIASGLPVIANKSVNFINEFIEVESVGAIMDFKDIDPEITQKLKLISKEKISELGKEKFGVDAITDQYINVYKSII